MLDLEHTHSLIQVPSLAYVPWDWHLMDHCVMPCFAYPSKVPSAAQKNAKPGPDLQFPVVGLSDISVHFGVFDQERRVS